MTIRRHQNIWSMRLPFLIFLLAIAGLAQSSEQPVNIYRASDLKIVDGPRVEAVTDRSAVIAWSTDVESSAIVRYGTDKENLDKKAFDQWGGRKTGSSVVHRVTLRDLQPNTKYVFEVESGQGWHKSPAVAKSETQGFATKSEGYKENAKMLPAEPLIESDNVVAGPMAINVTDSSATIWWMANDNLRGNVLYGKTLLSLNHRLEFTMGDQQVTLERLEPDTTYLFEVQDAAKKSLYEGSFRTEKSGFEEARFKIISGPTVEVVGRDTTTVSWATNARSSSVLRYGTDPKNLDQTAMAPWGQQSHRVVVKNLKPDTMYYFQIESAQAQGSGLSVKSSIGPFHTVADGQVAMRNPDWRR
jgi:hypothetical protein